MLHIFTTFRFFNFQSIRVRALFVALALFVCLTAAQMTTAQLNLTVTRNDDRNNAACVSGDCSLREAVNAANVSASDDAINFASGLTTVTLGNEIVVNNAGALTINGLGANVLTINGNAGNHRIFYTNQATVTVSGVTLTGGNGGGVNFMGYGGAIFANGGSLTLDRVYIVGNSAGVFGGGVNFRGGTHRINNSTFSANTALFCGSINNFGGTPGAASTLIVVNSTISGNTAPDSLEGDGGGICNGGDTTLRNVTITGNSSAGLGGGSGGLVNYGGGNLDLGNTIVAGNPVSDITNYDGEITSAGGNLVGYSNRTGVVYQPSDILDVNPLLGALQNNGGATPTHALLTGSPAIDKGVNSLAVDPFNNSILQTEQRGFARIVGSAVDIGAFEFGSAKSRKRIRFF